MSMELEPEYSASRQGRAPDEKDFKGEEEWEPTVQDAFGNEETAEVKYKVLKWWYVVCPLCYYT